LANRFPKERLSLGLRTQILRIRAAALILDPKKQTLKHVAFL
jgi:hypothetical protein